MDHEKADRLKVMLEEALEPVIERLDRIEKDMKELKEKENN